MKVKYLKIEEIVFFNKLQIETFSPQEPIGIASRSALEMSVAQPKITVSSEDIYKDIYEKAGILLINLIKKHPFFNANKRTAILSMNVFLEINGYQMNFSNRELVDLAVEIAVFNGNFDTLKEKVFSEIRKNTSKKN